MSLLLVLIIILYFLPTFMAVMQGQRQAAAIFMLNLFLGWTFIGWAIAIVWAFVKEADPVIVTVDSETASSNRGATKDVDPDTDWSRY